jgi:hypothetical protein
MQTSGPQPILTVAVPLFDLEGCIDRCLDSLTHPDGPLPARDVEILVVDDGSSDASAEVAAAYEDHHPRLKVLRKENGGQGSVIDHARSHATGIYFFVIDGDDEVVPDTFRRVVALLRWLDDRGTRLDALFLDRLFLDETTGATRRQRFHKVLPVNRTFGWQEIGRFGRFENLSLGSIVYRLGLLDECGLKLPRHAFFTDCIYTFVPLAHSRMLFHMPLPLLVYHKGREGQATSLEVALQRSNDRIPVIRAMAAALDGLPDGTPKKLERYLANTLSAFLLVSLGMFSLSDQDDRERKKTELIGWIRRNHRRIHRRVSGRPLVLLARIPDRPGRDLARIAFRFASAGHLLD